jgi:uncharacterized RDD family membrane protein YckC
MSQVPDWNMPPTDQAFPPIPPAQSGQVNAQAMMASARYAAPGMAPGFQVPPGFHYDQLSGLVIPDGTTLAPVGRRIGGYFLAILLSIVTLGIGYLIWGIIAWSKGQTPTQQVLGLQTWKPLERVNATWGTMFLRELAYAFVGIIPFAQLVSFFLFVSGKEHRTLHDSIASTIVLHDPNKVLRPTVAQPPAR